MALLLLLSSCATALWSQALIPAKHSLHRSEKKMKTLVKLVLWERKAPLKQYQRLQLFMSFMLAFKDFFFFGIGNSFSQTNYTGRKNRIITKEYPSIKQLHSKCFELCIPKTFIFLKKNFSINSNSFSVHYLLMHSKAII